MSQLCPACGDTAVKSGLSRSLAFIWGREQVRWWVGPCDGCGAEDGPVSNFPDVAAVGADAETRRRGEKNLEPGTRNLKTTADCERPKPCH